MEEEYVSNPWHKFVTKEILKKNSEDMKGVIIKRVASRWKEKQYKKKIGFDEFSMEVEHAMFSECEDKCHLSCCISLFSLFAKRPFLKSFDQNEIMKSHFTIEEITNCVFFMSHMLKNFVVKSKKKNKKKEEDILLVDDSLIRKTHSTKKIRNDKYVLSKVQFELIFHKLVQILNSNLKENGKEIDSTHCAEYCFSKLKLKTMSDLESEGEIRMCKTFRVICGISYLVSFLFQYDEHKSGFISVDLWKGFLRRISNIPKDKSEELDQKLRKFAEIKVKEEKYSYENVIKMIIVMDILV